jgi:Protein of unknown function (DUF4232)
MIRTRVAPLAAAVLLTALALTGCGGGGTPAVTDDPVVTPTPSPTESGSNPVPTGDAVLCTRELVEQEYVPTDNTAGQMHGILTTTNTSPEACTLDGYAVLYLGSGEVEGPVGQPASPETDTVPSTVVLEPGNVATAAVTITQAGNLEGCNLASTTHFVASPPLDHGFEFELDGQHVDIPETPICYNDDIGLLTVGPYELVAD